MEHRPHLEPGLFHPSEAGLDDPGALVTERDVLGRIAKGSHPVTGHTSADDLVVQTRQQRELARRDFPGRDPVVIPSFAEPAPRANGTGEYFLWADRLVEYKLPDRYVELRGGRPNVAAYIGTSSL